MKKIISILTMKFCFICLQFIFFNISCMQFVKKAWNYVKGAAGKNVKDLVLEGIPKEEYARSLAHMYLYSIAINLILKDGFIANFISELGLTTLESGAIKNILSGGFLTGSSAIKKLNESNFDIFCGKITNFPKDVNPDDFWTIVLNEIESSYQNFSNLLYIYNIKAPVIILPSDKDDFYNKIKEFVLNSGINQANDLSNSINSLAAVKKAVLKKTKEKYKNK